VSGVRLLDCVIIGGGPAGLSAALVLGRCCRQVAVVDAGEPRNRRSPSSHGLLTRDGTSPAEIRRVARAQLEPYSTVEIIDDEVVQVSVDESGCFSSTTRSNALLRSKKLLLATGMRDRVPDVPGMRERIGRGIYVCPYCDAWELRGKRMAIYAPAREAADLALALLTWSHEVTLVTPGELLEGSERELVTRYGVRVFEQPVTSIGVAGEALETVTLASGQTLAVDALFIHFGSEQAAPFARELSCALGERGAVVCKEGERAGVPGVFVAGDASHDLQLLAVAIAEGAKAACAINTELRREHFR